MRLLGEVDRQINDGIATALSMTAIEALLESKGPEGTRRMADAIGSLLEPDPSQRFNAVDYVMKLYRVRSEIIHGELKEIDKEKKIQARILASSILYSLRFRLDMQNRMGDKPDTIDDLMKELDKRKFDTGSPGGVPDVKAA